MVKIAPSLLASDFGKLKEELEKLEQAGADMLHIDIMDGKFVPNISFGFPILDAVKKYSSLPLDIHLMIEEPYRYFKEFASYEPEFITFHGEGENHLHKNIYEIKSMGIKAGVALNPGTTIDTLSCVKEDLDLLLFMTVNPGFGGQKFISSVLSKMDKANKLFRPYNKNLLFEVDGGVEKDTAKMCRDYGADILVAGSYILGNKDYKKAIHTLR